MTTTTIQHDMQTIRVVCWGNDCLTRLEKEKESEIRIKKKGGGGGAGWWCWLAGWLAG